MVVELPSGRSRRISVVAVSLKKTVRDALTLGRKKPSAADGSRAFVEATTLPSSAMMVMKYIPVVITAPAGAASKTPSDGGPAVAGVATIGLTAAPDPLVGGSVPVARLDGSGAERQPPRMSAAVGAPQMNA